MSEWECDSIQGSVRWDWQGSFDEQVSRLRSVEGGAFKLGSHNYWVLRALFHGDTVDDYLHPPRNDRGMPVRNVRSRIADLRHNWRIAICDKKAEGANYKIYMIHGRTA